MEKRPAQFTLPLFGDSGWDASGGARPAASSPTNKRTGRARTQTPESTQLTPPPAAAKPAPSPERPNSPLEKVVSPLDQDFETPVVAYVPPDEDEPSESIDEEEYASYLRETDDPPQPAVSTPASVPKERNAYTSRTPKPIGDSGPEYTPPARRPSLEGAFAPRFTKRAPVERAPVDDGELFTPPPRSAPRSQPAKADDAERVISVADLDRRLKRVVEGATENVRVSGEVSNLKAHASGHTYFTLKDENEDASIDCVMYRTAPAKSRRILEDGARVVLRGKATLFAPRGRLQLVADEARLEGRGALLEALERLKEKLAAEGLFDPSRKRPLPRDPKVIGVVTSASGAAIHDILKVAFARGAARFVLARAPVQGRDAAPRMARALAALSKMRDVEVIIVGRGGGSADDLLAFNEEVLIREAARCRVPVVSAVGHEIDISILDLVADARAATPSQAAEMLVPDANARRADLSHLALRMRRAVVHAIHNDRTLLEKRERRLAGFRHIISAERQVIDELLLRAEREIGRVIGHRRVDLQTVDRALWARHPRTVVVSARSAIVPLARRLLPAKQARIADEKRRIEGLSTRLARAFEKVLTTRHTTLGEAATRLHAMSPLAVLGRGYAIVTKDGRALHSSADVSAGDSVSVRLHKGSITAQVTGVKPDTSG
ncbi:MAG: exodeoxyribonuclease VII large subunit [Polyangiaceae bacterium]|nr:exodeoxyribonuclease VII large subunit [Polyangiaceae bacterium]